MFIQLPSHGHTLHYQSSSPALRESSPAADIIGRREEGEKYLLHLVDCVFLFPLLSSLQEVHCFCNCLKCPEWPLPSVPGRGQEEERGCGARGSEAAGSGQHPGQGQTRRAPALPCLALPCLSLPSPPFLYLPLPIFAFLSLALPSPPLPFLPLPCLVLSSSALPCLPFVLVQAGGQPRGMARSCFGLQPAPALFWSCLRTNTHCCGSVCS